MQISIKEKKLTKNTFLKLIIALSEPKMSMYLAEAELLDNSSHSCDYDSPQTNSRDKPTSSADLIFFFSIIYCFPTAYSRDERVLFILH